jgi:hypothetical protein
MHGAGADWVRTHPSMWERLSPPVSVPFAMLSLQGYTRGSRGLWREACALREHVRAIAALTAHGFFLLI